MYQIIKKSFVRNVLFLFAFGLIVAGLIKISFLPYGFIMVVVFLSSPILAMQSWMMLAQFRLLVSIQSDRRLVSPYSVFICLVPVIGQFWNFVLATRISQSLQLEFKFRNYDSTGENYGETSGIFWAASFFGSTILPLITYMVDTDLGMKLLVFFFLPWLLAYMGSITRGLEYAYVLNAHREHLWGKGVAHQTEEQRDFGEE